MARFKRPEAQGIPTQTESSKLIGSRGRQVVCHAAGPLIKAQKSIKARNAVLGHRP